MTPKPASTDTPWTKSYPAGMRWDAELPITPVQQLLDDAVARWPARPAIEFMGQVISYSELGAMVERAAKGLQALGVKPGVHVGLYLPNTPHYPIAFFAVLKAGGTVVNYSPLDAERVLAHKIEDSQTDVLVTLDLVSLYPQLGRMLGASRLQKLVVGSLSDFGAAREQVRAHLQGAGQLAPVPTDAQHVPFPALLENDGRYQAYPLGDLPEAIAVLQYTGGTTGLPKGAMITHANLTAAVGQYWESTQAEPKIIQEGAERILVVLPLFHIYSLSVCLLLGVRLGAALVLHTRFDVDAVMKELTASKITIFPGVPTMFAGLLMHPNAATMDLRSLKLCNSGGASLPVEIEQRFFKLTGCHLNEGWGMTETSPVGTFTPAQG
ncbi:MAG: AMP-binding protein, partial [Rhodoferax sp.]